MMKAFQSAGVVPDESFYGAWRERFAGSLVGRAATEHLVDPDRQRVRGSYQCSFVPQV